MVQRSFVPAFSAFPLIIWDSSTANVSSFAVSKAILSIWHRQWILELEPCPADTTHVVHIAHYLMLEQQQHRRASLPAVFLRTGISPCLMAVVRMVGWEECLGTDISEPGLVFSVRQFSICRHRYLSSVSCFGCPHFKGALENCRGFRGELRRTSAVQNPCCCQRPSKVITLKRQDHSDLALLWHREKKQPIIWAGWKYDRTQWAEASYHVTHEMPIK